jgi:hypothetical protein
MVPIVIARATNFVALLRSSASLPCCQRFLLRPGCERMTSFESFESFDGVGIVVTNRFSALMHILRFVLAAKAKYALADVGMVWYGMARPQVTMQRRSR